MTVTLTPQGSRLLLSPIKPDEKTANGLFLATVQDKNPPMGVVLSFGPDVNLYVEEGGNTRALRPGDRVIYERMTETSYFPNIADNDSRVAVVLAQNILLTIAGE